MYRSVLTRFNACQQGAYKNRVGPPLKELRTSGQYHYSTTSNRFEAWMNNTPRVNMQGSFYSKCLTRLRCRRQKKTGLE